MHSFTLSSSIQRCSIRNLGVVRRFSSNVHRWQSIGLDTPSAASSTKKPQDKPFYITTPIFYVNADPHIGHLHSMLVADIFKRWQVLKDHNVVLTTGVDEHGMKVQQAASKAKTEPGLFCDRGAKVFEDLARRADIQYDHFVRTTAEDHKQAVEYAWYRLKEKGFIYTSKHEGWYSVSDETFYPEKNVHLVVDPSSGRKMMASTETGKEVEWTSEKNYHFRLSAFREPLLTFYSANPEWMEPRSRYEQTITEVENGLSDLSISRPSSRLTWGIRVPDDSSQTIYVWLDALTNYITKAGYPWAPGEECDGGWPADIQIIGKDITRFHCIYWPAFLMALDIPPPRRIYTHSHWLLGNQKMSKSIGNVVNPFFAIDRWGADTLRTYMAYSGRSQDDQSYANEFIYERYEKLRNSLGNLTSRVLRGRGWQKDRANIVAKYAQNQTFAQRPSSEQDAALWDQLQLVKKDADNLVSQQLDIRRALHLILDLVNATDRYIHVSQPWTLCVKGSEGPAPERVQEIIYLCLESLRITGIVLQPYMPGKAGRLLSMLGVGRDRRTLAYAELNKDASYGLPEPGSFLPGIEGVLFPPIQKEEISAEEVREMLAKPIE